MSLIVGRLNELLYEAKDHVNLDEAAEIASVLRCTGRYGSEVAELARDVLAAMRVLAGPDGDNARFLSRSSR